MPPAAPADRQKRPRRVTFLAFGVLTLGMINLWRAAALSGDWALLAPLGVTLDPRLRLLMAAMWALVFLAIAWSLWRGRPRGRTAVPWALLFYALYRLLLLAAYVASPVARARWPGVVVAHGAGLAFALWAVHGTAARPYFGLPPLTLSRLTTRRQVPEEKSHV